MTVYKNENRFGVSNVEIKNGVVTEYDKSRTNYSYIDYGLSIFKRNAMANAKGDLSSIFKQLISHRSLASFEVDTRFYEIGSQKGLQDFTEWLEHRSKVYLPTRSR
jgi:hypothetical protein